MIIYILTTLPMLSQVNQWFTITILHISYDDDVNIRNFV